MLWLALMQRPDAVFLPTISERLFVKLFRITRKLSAITNNTEK